MKYKFLFFCFFIQLPKPLNFKLYGFWKFVYNRAMKKKEIKKTKLKPRTKAEAKENRLGVILERMEHKFDLLAEGFLGLDKKIVNNHKEFKDFRKETNDNFKTLFKFRNEMIDFKNGTNSNFKTNFEYLSQIDNEIQSIKKEMAEMRNNIINGERIDPVKFFEIERRVETVEKELNINPQMAI